AVERPVGPARRDRDNDRLGALQRLFETGVGARAVEDEDLDAPAPDLRRPLVRPNRAARLDRRRQPNDCLGAIAEAEEEDFHCSSGFSLPEAQSKQIFPDGPTYRNSRSVRRRMCSSCTLWRRRLLATR